jgi:hypothetical protein
VNWQTGLFCAWIALSTLWALFVGSITSTEIMNLIRCADSTELLLWCDYTVPVSVRFEEFFVIGVAPSLVLLALGLAASRVLRGFRKV